jgi:tryptophanyl-tRNA synthetase
MASLRHSVGLRDLRSSAQAAVAKVAKTGLPSLKQYREKDGLFYFKLVDPKGRLLLQSLSFATPREAAQAIAQLHAIGAAALPALAAQLQPVPDVSPEDLASALALLS